ncbi:MAG TPA: membrane protein insertion efficiency factor YidD [Firmicutes bacterium]|nr:membrane protein insertion efficiency factor YidD [Bacillota bacterium]
MKNPLVKISILLISGYQVLISPLFSNSCRFYPTCSEYTKQSIVKHGFIKGIWHGIKRIFRCNPFNPGGYDPVR